VVRRRVSYAELPERFAAGAPQAPSGIGSTAVE
jgi:hypothetical protein